MACARNHSTWNCSTHHNSSEEFRVPSLYQAVPYIVFKTLLLNFTFKGTHLQQRTSNCKKDTRAFFCRQNRSQDRGTQVFQTDSLFWQEKLRPGHCRACSTPPHSAGLDAWECGPDRVHSTGLESGPVASSR